MQRWVVACSLAFLLRTAFAAEVCPDGGRCEDGLTCCRRPNNRYDCCRGGKSLRMIKPNLQDDNSTICPDQSSRCPSEYSCLRAFTNYACCPLAEGISCPDGKHCCPQGHSCSEDSRSCLKNEEQHVTSKVATDSESEEGKVDDGKAVASPDVQVSVVPCNDTVGCQDGQTCCKTYQEQWACCPLPNAVCCDDLQHCCASGYTCVKGECYSSSDSQTTPMSRKTAAFTTAAKVETQVTEPDQAEQTESEEEEEDEEDEDVESRVLCKGHKNHTCPKNNTCCRHHCCPHSNATCCRGRHCCPHGYTCHNKKHSCTKGEEVIPWYDEVPAQPGPQPRARVPVEMQVVGEVPQSEQTETEEDEEDDDDEDVDNSVECKGSPCPKHTTRCCPKGCHKCMCCPLPKATCCSDGKHCCPHGFKCKVKVGKCFRDEEVIPWFTKIPALDSPKPVDEESKVIELDQTEWAESDDDKDDEGDDDDKDDEGDEDEDDDDEDEERGLPCKYCPGTFTCCFQSYCCPFSNATCCSDGEYCCPHGYECRAGQQKCAGPDGVEDFWYSMTPVMDSSKTVYVKAKTDQTEWAESDEDDEADEDDDGDDDDDDDDDEDIERGHRCKNGTCPKNGTCCGRGRRQHCCRHRNATCCPGGHHCCPCGFQCHPRRNKCVKDGQEIPWDTTVPVQPSPEPVYVETQIFELDLVETDPSEQTESDEEDTDDDDENSDGDDEDEEDLVRCDDKSTCPKGSSCCNCGDGWGCCPLPNGVCCSDGKHCCPHLYKCSESRNACVRDDTVIPWSSKLPALSDLERVSEKNVVCPDKHYCPDRNTCCEMESEGYGCCPLPKAVCCSDKVHCCPNGYNCTPDGCQQSVVQEFVPLKPAQSESKRCGRTLCSDEEKCCMNRGMPHCCLKDYVCCDAGYCCPSGQSCEGRGKCTSKSVSIWDVFPFFFQRAEEDPLIL